MPSKKSRRKKRTMSWKSRRELFEENKIRLELQEETEIPVSLEDWMSLSKTDGETKAKIRAMMQADLDRKQAAGFAEVVKNFRKKSRKARL